MEDFLSLLNLLIMVVSAIIAAFSAFAFGMFLYKKEEPFSILWMLGLCELCLLLFFSSYESSMIHFFDEEVLTIKNYPFQYLGLSSIGAIFILISYVYNKNHNSNEDNLGGYKMSKKNKYEILITSDDTSMPSANTSKTSSADSDEDENEDDDDEDEEVDDEEDEFDIDEICEESYDSPEYKQFYNKLVGAYGNDIANQVVILRKLLQFIVNYDEYSEELDYYKEFAKSFYQSLVDAGKNDDVNKAIIEFYGWSHIDDSVEIDS